MLLRDGDDADRRMCAAFSSSPSSQPSRKKGKMGGGIMKGKRTKIYRSDERRCGMSNDFLLFLQGLIVLSFYEIIPKYNNEFQMFSREGCL